MTKAQLEQAVDQLGLINKLEQCLKLLSSRQTADAISLLDDNRIREQIRVHAFSLISEEIAKQEACFKSL
jgi:hypothetical protein